MTGQWKLEDLNAPFEPARTPFWLSRDPAQVDAYIGDPLCGFTAAACGRLGAQTHPPRSADVPISTP